jgi:hypothetical protein
MISKGDVALIANFVLFSFNFNFALTFPLGTQRRRTMSTRHRSLRNGSRLLGGQQMSNMMDGIRFVIWYATTHMT